MNPAPNLILVGPMGAGKSSIGKRLAARFGLQFVDADQHIEHAAGATVAMIFELEGETGFRRREEQALAELFAGQARVIATGGGAVLSAGTRAQMRARGFVVYLKVGVAQQLERLARDHSRPLLSVGEREQTLRALAQVRDPLYEEVADLVFESGGLSVASAASKVGARVQAQWRREEAA